MSLLVRTWNVFHGNAVPPERHAFLEQMVRLVTSDVPGVVCLQEVPLWALRHLQRWSGMTSSGAVAARPRLLSAELGRIVTELHHGLFRSAFTGQANAILVASTLRVHDPTARVISESGERRVCQAVRVADVGVVANFHVTGGASADEQFRRAADFADELAGDDEPVVLAGDANLRPGSGDTYAELHDRGYSEPLAGSIDQVLVRGLPSSSLVRWPEERRRAEGRLLSDHTPVELHVG